MVVVTSVRAARAPAALRVVAPAAPLRLPRRRPRPAAPAVDRPGVPRLDRPPPSTGGRCGARPPRRCSSGGSGCRCTARCATACASRRWCRRATTSSRSTSPAATCTGLPVERRPVPQLAVPRPGPAGPAPTPTRCPRPRTGAACGSPSRRSATAARVVRCAAPRHPGARSRARTGGSPSGPAPARRWPSSAPASASRRCARSPRRCPTRRATPSLLQRATRRPLFARELDVLARERGLQVRWLPGRRRSPDSWLGDGRLGRRPHHAAALGPGHRRARRLRLRPAGVDGRRPPHAARRRRARRAAARRELRVVTR